MFYCVHFFGILLITDSYYLCPELTIHCIMAALLLYGNYSTQPKLYDGWIVWKVR